MLMLETVKKSLDRLNVAQLVKLYADTMPERTDAETTDKVDWITEDAIFAALESINPAAYRAWKNNIEVSTVSNNPTPADLAARDSMDLYELRRCYGVA